MRLIFILSMFIGISIILNSCDNFKKNKEAKERIDLKKVDSALREYFTQKNASSEYYTEIKQLKPISIKEIDETNKKSNEEYIADVFLRATIRMIHGSRVYNVNDTIECYLNKDFVVQRTENKPDRNKDQD